MSALVVAIGCKQTWVAAPHMSAFDPKRTLAAVSPRSNRPVHLSQTNSVGGAIARNFRDPAHTMRGAHGNSTETPVFTSPFLFLLHDRRGFRRHRRLAHTAPSLRSSAWARHSYQR